MTDISFLLIIFFLVTAVFTADQGLKLALPDKESEPKQLPPEDVIEIVIDDNGEYLLEGVSPTGGTGLPGLEREIGVLVERNPDSVVLVKAAETVIYQQVLDVLSAAKSAGAGRFSIISESSDPLPVSLEDTDL